MTDKFLATLANTGLDDFHTFFDDFDNYTSGDWTVTTTGSGTVATSSADGGVLVVTNSAADNDAVFLQWQGTTSAATVETFKFTAGKRMLLKMRFKVLDATQSDFVFGLQTTDTTPLATANGLWFQKVDDAAAIDFCAAVGSVQTTVAAIATLVNDTYTVLKAYYDGSNAYIQLFKDDVAIGRCALTNAPTVTLTPSFGLQNGAAVANVLSIDYVRFMVER